MNTISDKQVRVILGGFLLVFLLVIIYFSYPFLLPKDKIDPNSVLVDQVREDTPIDQKDDFGVAVYGNYSEDTKQYKIFKYDLTTDERTEIYSFPVIENFIGPSIRKLDESTILIFTQQEKVLLIGLDGQAKSGTFIPSPGHSYHFSPDYSKIIYQTVLPRPGVTYGPSTITIRDMQSGESFYVKPEGEGMASVCGFMGWKADSSEVYCTLTYGYDNEIFSINATTGKLKGLGISGGQYYSESNLVFEGFYVTGGGDLAPPSRLEVMNTITKERKILIQSEDSVVSLGKFNEDSRMLLFTIGEDIYKAHIDDIANTKVLLVENAYPSNIVNENKFTFVTTNLHDGSWDNTKPIIDTISIFYGKNQITELFSEDRSGLGGIFVGWFR